MTSTEGGYIGRIDFNLIAISGNAVKSDKCYGSPFQKGTLVLNWVSIRGKSGDRTNLFTASRN